MNSNPGPVWRLNFCSTAIPSAHTGWIFSRRNMQCLHHQRRLWCMTWLTRLINDLSKAHITSLGDGCGHMRGEAGAGASRECESRRSRWCRWQMWTSLGITLQLWYSDWKLCNLWYLIFNFSYTSHHSQMFWTWMTFEIQNSNTAEQRGSICALGSLEIILFRYKIKI